jgi:uncharacterized protein YqiB (DUF1249 family)
LLPVVVAAADKVMEVAAAVQLAHKAHRLGPESGLLAALSLLAEVAAYTIMVHVLLAHSQQMAYLVSAETVLPELEVAVYTAALVAEAVTSAAEACK